jgi:nitrite reductase/ring-hydroxylating ferredoxin subunit
MTEHLVAKTGDIKDNEAKRVVVGSNEIAIYNLGGKFYATDDICTHAYASMADGFIEDGIVECPLHAGRFEICTGKALGVPVVQDLKVFKLRVDGENIYVDVD